MEYKRLGDYIEPIDERNSKLEVKLSQGINNNKYFQEPKQVAENSAADKIVRQGYFAYNRATTRNGEKISIAYREGPDCTVSSAYQVFRIKDEEKLNPKYLLMWYKRPDFDRYARFRSHGSAHEFFEYDEMCDVYLPLPDIARQREIVEEYETLSRRIRLNELIIEKLEATAQALYRKMFVDGIDKENLPEGWRMGSFVDVVKISGGGTPDTDEPSYWNGDILFFTPADSCDSFYCINTEKQITTLGFNNCSSKMYEKDTTFITARGTVGKLSLASTSMAMNQSCYAFLPKITYTPFYIHQFAFDAITSLKEEAVGAVFNALVTKDFETKTVVIPDVKAMENYNTLVIPVYHSILIIQQENSKLSELQSLLLAKMGNLKQ